MCAKHFAYFQGITFVSIDESFMRARKFTTLWVVACLFGTYGWIVYPLLTCAKCLTLPLPSWYPFDVKLPFGYMTAFIFQFFGQTFVGIGNFDHFNSICDSNCSHHAQDMECVAVCLHHL